jgi:hypothetical protein
VEDGAWLHCGRFSTGGPNRGFIERLKKKILKNQNKPKIDNHRMTVR